MAKRPPQEAALPSRRFLRGSKITQLVNPAVGNVDTGSDYFVAYQDGNSLFGPWNIRGRRVDGGTVTTTSALVDVAATTANEITPDVSGDNSATSSPTASNRAMTVRCQAQK